MAKEFDLHLRNRLTECDIIVYSIPYRDGLTAMNRVILGSCLENYKLQKFIALQTGSSLITHIDEMIKTCYERLGLNANIAADVGFETHYALCPQGQGVALCAQNAKLLASAFIQAQGALGIGAAALSVSVGKSIGGGETAILPEAQIRTLLKRAIERAYEGQIIRAEIEGTNTEKKITVETGSCITAEMTDLCYQMSAFAQTAMEITAGVLGTELRFPFGHAHSAIAANAGVKATKAQKFEAAQSCERIMCQMSEIMRLLFKTEGSGAVLNAEAEGVIRRLRLLSETDGEALGDMDDTTLGDIDFVDL